MNNKGNYEMLYSNNGKHKRNKKFTDKQTKHLRSYQQNKRFNKMSEATEL